TTGASAWTAPGCGSAIRRAGRFSAIAPGSRRGPTCSCPSAGPSCPCACSTSVAASIRRSPPATAGSAGRPRSTWRYAGRSGLRCCCCRSTTPPIHAAKRSSGWTRPAVACDCRCNGAWNEATPTDRAGARRTRRRCRTAARAGLDRPAGARARAGAGPAAAAGDGAGGAGPGRDLLRGLPPGAAARCDAQARLAAFGGHDGRAGGQVARRGFHSGRSAAAHQGVLLRKRAAELPRLPYLPPSTSQVRFRAGAIGATSPTPLVTHVAAGFGSVPNDLVVSDAGRGAVLRLWQRDGKWHEQVLGEFVAPAHAQVVDLDGDGRLDVVVAEMGEMRPTGEPVGKVVVLLGEADGSFLRRDLVEGLGRVTDVRAA